MNKIEHIGIAVADLKAAGNLYEKLLNTTIYKIEDVASEGVKTAFLQNGPNKIELLEASTEDSPIAKFIAKKGEGIHHIAFEVNDIKAEMARLKSEGFILLSDEPKHGADNKLVCFVHPKSAGGVLVELVQEVGENVTLQKYKVRFYKKIVHDRYRPFMSSISDMLDMFFMDYYQAYLVKNFIILYIDKVLDDVDPEIIIVSESVISIKISKDTSEIYGWDDSPKALPVFVFPTQDFKEIAIEWMNYLQFNSDFKT